MYYFSKLIDQVTFKYPGLLTYNLSICLRNIICENVKSYNVNGYCVWVCTPTVDFVQWVKKVLKTNDLKNNELNYEWFYLTLNYVLISH